MKYFIYIVQFLVISTSVCVHAQDMDNDFVQNEIVVSDNSVPLPAPIFFEDSIPNIDKDSIKIRLKKLEKTIPLTLNNNVMSFIHYFTVRNRDYTKIVLRRKDNYFHIFEAILKEYHMPDELKYLSIVESGLNPRARSRAGAVGLWQFVRNTGEYYKLHTDWYIDERSDPEKSTRAACVYLKYLHDRFGNWELALAAYNCGPTNVSRAIKASRNRRDFWEIFYHLPRETRSYVPQFIAVTYVMNYHKEHNLYPDYYENTNDYCTIYTENYINIDILSQKLGVCPDEILKYNPTLIKNVVPAYRKNFPLKLPSHLAHKLMSDYCHIMDTSATIGNEEMINDINPFSERSKNRLSVTHVVKRGEVLEKIARKHKVKVSELMAWNNLKSKKIKYGQKLVVWREGVQQNDDKKVAHNSHKEIKSKKLFYLVQPGDTLWSISLKNNVPVSKLKKLNKIKSDELKPGQKILVG
ncbi:MAG: LysM peptidoglycan-binding domain-containing protein [Cytophagales bacterium]|nr:LysM peptidoglycan-binding domain-containing protein [Cytophagales bacterium]